MIPTPPRPLQLLIIFVAAVYGSMALYAVALLVAHVLGRI